MKKCTSCSEVFPLIFFAVSKKSKDGLHIYCNDCNRKKASDWYKKNKERVSKSAKDKYVKNRDKKKSASNEYYERTKDARREKLRESVIAWAKANPYKRAQAKARRRAAKISGTPSWLNGWHKKQMAWFYEAAHMMTATSGIEHNVDHIHPLQGSGFCGLHVPWNLRAIPAKINSAKCNRLPPEDAHLSWEGA